MLSKQSFYNRHYDFILVSLLVQQFGTAAFHLPSVASTRIALLTSYVFAAVVTTSSGIIPSDLSIHDVLFLAYSICRIAPASHFPLKVPLQIYYYQVIAIFNEYLLDHHTLLAV